MRIQLSLITHADYFRINPGVIYIRESLTNNVIDSFTFAGAAYDSDSLDVLTAVLNYQYGKAVRRHPAGKSCDTVSQTPTCDLTYYVARHVSRCTRPAGHMGWHA